MENFVALLGLSTLSSCLVLLVLWVSRGWFITRLTKSIEYEYATKLEEYKYQIEVKKKAELVAKLLAHWITRPDAQEELNRMTFECFLWLPDEIAGDLGKLLSHKHKDEVSIYTVVNKIRKHLNYGDDKFQSLEDWQVIVFTDESKEIAFKKAIASSIN